MQDPNEVLLGESEKMRHVKDQIRRAQSTSVTVLITGESGTGKDVAAKLIHSVGKFVAINCAAIPKELIESELFGHTKGSFTGASATRTGKLDYANGGTLFLDEIAEMPLLLQSKLLRAIESGYIERVGSNTPIVTSFRLICATNRNIEAMVTDGTFRRDLYYRINVFRIEMPSLRDIAEDVPVIFDSMLNNASTRYARNAFVSREAKAAVAEHFWPGNARELKNVAERIVVGCDGVVSVDDIKKILKTQLLPVATSMPAFFEAIVKPSLPMIASAYADGNVLQAVRDFESELIKTVLDRESGCESSTARVLGMSRNTLRARLGKPQGSRHGA